MDDPHDYCATETPHVDCETPPGDNCTLSNDNAQLSTRCPHCNADLTAPEDMDVELVYATLHFYHGNPESMRRFREVNQAADVKAVLCEYDRWLRDQLKYHKRDDAEGLRVARDRLWMVLGEWSVGLDDE